MTTPIPIEQIQSRRQHLDFEIIPIRWRFDLNQLKEKTLRILSEHPPILKDGYSTYSGVGLHYSNAENPIYDCVEQSSFISPLGEIHRVRPEPPRAFTKKNILAEEFSEVFDAFKDLTLYRGRLLKAEPGHIHAEHIDGPRDCRIHIPIITNRYSLMYFGDRPYHMPADGTAYLCNTSRPHHFVNLGQEDRIHLVFII